MKKVKIATLITLFLIGILLIWIKVDTTVTPPEIEDKTILDSELIIYNDSTKLCEDSWIRKNTDGLWEMYVSGTPFEIGVKTGKLSSHLIKEQEEIFVSQLKKMIPSEGYLNFLKYFVGIYNRDMDEYIPIENQKEIYGVSLFGSDKFDFIAPNYHRILNYHGAHDIGHAMQNLNLVACTAFGVNEELSSDSGLLIGRNFDFYMGEEFAKEKIIAFYSPENGHQFVSITWGGMTGVLSGMNCKGLTISLNAAKSEIPLKAKCPVSILARNILQHAENIDEAWEIAKNSSTFVSESFFIGSAKDNRCVVIEKSPSNTTMYTSDSNKLILTNHFQSEQFKNTQLTKENILESASLYRYERVDELLDSLDIHNEFTFAEILRDRFGKRGENIGLGNENAINQLIAHHSVIFKPDNLQMWVSTSPFQLGKYICYDLNKIFNDSINLIEDLVSIELTIPKDSFINTKAWENFKEYKSLNETLLNSEIENLNDSIIEKIIKYNPEYFDAYRIAGELYMNQNKNDKAISCFKTALKKNIPRSVDKNKITELLQEINE